ncbi:hypothetical protein HRR83_001161 [Exophiala dermatitidis]|uniref:Protein kinase domain-containing protein n=2 Tax=Exophiala dermatitidis TaxID=5970 RepID=H6C766_EXODN|nr:uncharacterized protein HMPREF1120_07550 [Exophiala dermatitidis NIH/UT8656]KAJ4522671.1 hypothetical protein HRR75_001065 [Exophiala dermatitidis]EHY59562.1 hypothetical protein HMPREF1120_07550 [Exophiala dermatitidis NIH/UT8656]KAJ4525972.1 hypothetical protein HRR74_001165 [Exophiala dermatitidis]KAJ4527081.1 hypothetical protein HRR73_001878 [Exophiala dermatitidis]KAJ4532799.1 hypothetical protein HRR76_007779 [Exophiala dermatitidis]
MIFSEFVKLDGARVTEKVIGVGGTGLVIQRGQYAVKIPRLSRDFDVNGVVLLDESLPPSEGDYDIGAMLVSSLEREKNIYRRLGSHSGIVRCSNLSSSTDSSIQLDFMKNGDLKNYLLHLEARPAREVQLFWFTQMARTLAHIHHRRVIVADIRLQNFLLDDQLAIKFVDFGESTLMPLDWDLNGPDEDGYSIQTDLEQLGSVMYEVVTGQSGKLDVMLGTAGAGQSASEPRQGSRPSTGNIWLGCIIDKCWSHGFSLADDLAAGLERQLICKT